MNITDQEMTALLELAGRAPMSRAEALWLQMVIRRWHDSQRPDTGEAEQEPA